MHRVRRVMPVAFVLLAAAGCGDPDACEGGECVEPTLTSIHTEVLSQRCAYAGCHNAAGTAGLDLSTVETSFASLVSAEADSGLVPVVPNSPEDSHLINRLTGEGLTADQDRMPPFGEPLDAETIAVIEQWILDGCVIE